MRRDSVHVESAGRLHALEFTTRDWRILGGSGPLFPEGQRFVRMLGVWESFTMLQGVPRGSRAVRTHAEVLAETRALAAAVERDRALLGFDYQYSFSQPDLLGRPAGSRHSARLHGIHVRGRPASITANPKGYLTLGLLEVGPDGKGRYTEHQDLRAVESLETDDVGTLRVHRRKAPLGWPDSLPALIAFLVATPSEQVTIHHRLVK